MVVNESTGLMRPCLESCHERKSVWVVDAVDHLDAVVNVGWFGTVKGGGERGPWLDAS